MADDQRTNDSATPEQVVLARRAKLAADLQARADRMQNYILYGNSRSTKPHSVNRPAPEAETRRPQSSAG